VRRFVPTLLLVALLASACTGSPTPAESAAPSSPAPTQAAPSPDLAAFYSQTVAWSDCGDGFVCGTVSVPMDYTAPTGRTLELAVIKRPADEPDNRIGSLLVNPGGPGSSGVEYARNADRIVRDGIRERYDIVGFDPRGVSGSEPLDCLDDAQLDRLLAFDGTPDTAAEEAQVVLLTQQFIAGCRADDAALLPFIGTDDAARDMDVIRAAVGDPRLYYFGASYGTFLGASYAELFPERVGRLVLDGAVDPAVSGRDLGKAQAEGFELAIGAFIADCYTQDDCPLPQPASAAQARIAQLFSDTDAKPLRSESGRAVTESLATIGVITAMYDEASGWPILRDAFDGDGSLLLALADLYADRGEDGSYANNQNEVIVAVNCFDRPQTGTLATVKTDAVEFASVSPLFGEYIAWGGVSCNEWPAKSPTQPTPVTAAGSAPILVTGTVRDPATPYQWAVNLAGQLESGRLLTYDGDGHTAYTRGSDCIDDAVDAYLLEGTLPAEGTVCR
jgi:pimeloyl-ACP methyl ester carboxylesterase